MVSVMMLWHPYACDGQCIYTAYGGSMLYSYAGVVEFCGVLYVFCVVYSMKVEGELLAMLATAMGVVLLVGFGSALCCVWIFWAVV